MNARQRPRPARRGGIFLEMTISCSLLVLLLALLAHMGAVFLRQQSSSSKREFVARIAENLMDAALTNPYEELTVERLSETNALPDSARGEFSDDASWEVADAETHDGLAGRRIRLTLSWRNGPAARSLSITGWRFHAAEKQETEKQETEKQETEKQEEASE